MLGCLASKKKGKGEIYNYLPIRLIRQGVRDILFTHILERQQTVCKLVSSAEKDRVASHETRAIHHEEEEVEGKSQRQMPKGDRHKVLPYTVSILSSPYFKLKSKKNRYLAFLPNVAFYVTDLTLGSLSTYNVKDGQGEEKVVKDAMNFLPGESPDRNAVSQEADDADEEDKDTLGEPLEAVELFGNN